MSDLDMDQCDHLQTNVTAHPKAVKCLSFVQQKPQRSNKLQWARDWEGVKVLQRECGEFGRGLGIQEVICVLVQP